MRLDDLQRGQWVTIHRATQKIEPPPFDPVEPYGIPTELDEIGKGEPMLILCLNLPYVSTLMCDGNRTFWDTRRVEFMPLKRDYVTSLLGVEGTLHLERAL